MAVRLAPLPAAAPAPSRDRSLQAARRLDWRFLLPEPQLGRVAYLGPGEDGLLAALREWGASVAVAPRDAQGASFDVAVAQAPDDAALARAAALLRPGGWLYCELGRPPLWPRRAPRAADAPCGLARASHRLRALAFEDVEAYWHHPDFERCRWMVPIGHAPAGAFVVGRTAGRVAAALVTALHGRVLRAGHAARLVPGVSLVARRGGGA